MGRPLHRVPDATVIRTERWWFSYGRKFRGFPISLALASRILGKVLPFPVFGALTGIESEYRAVIGGTLS